MVVNSNSLLITLAVMRQQLSYICFLFLFSGISIRAFAFGDSSDRKSFSISIQTFASDSVSCIIPFNRVGNLIVLKARVDSIEGNFILDTGAPHLVLNITYFRDYPSTFIADAEQQSIAGNTSSLSKTSIGKLSFGAMEYYKTEADLVSLGDIENAKGIKVIGLLGVELFKKCEIIIDFEKNLIYLHRIGKKESSSYRHESLKDTSLYRIFSIDITDGRIMTNSEAAGKKIKLVIDCAAETSILDSRLPDKVFEGFDVLRRVKVVGPGNKKIDALYGNLSKIKIGDADINGLPVIITNLENTCFSNGGCVDGVLGFDFLSLHKIGFNFVKRKMYIWK